MAKTVSKIIRELIAAGKPHDEAVALALEIKKESKSKKRKK